MMLDWCNPATPLTLQDRISAILLEIGGAVNRDSLLTLLSGCVRRSRLDEVLGQMRRAGLIGAVFTEGHKAIYFLTADGSTYGKRLLGIRTKVRYGQSSIAYALTVEALLMRFVEAWGLQGWEFHGQYEASDEIAFFRAKQGVSEAEIKKAAPIPSALIRTPRGTVCFISVDCHHSSRMVYDETRRYITSLFTRDEHIPVVLFVAATGDRARWMRARARANNAVKIGFCGVEQVVDVLEGTVAPIR